MERERQTEGKPAATRYLQSSRLLSAICTHIHTWLAADTYVSDRYTTQSLASPKFASVRVYNHPLLFNTFNTFRIAFKNFEGDSLQGQPAALMWHINCAPLLPLPWLECVLIEWHLRDKVFYSIYGISGYIFNKIPLNFIDIIPQRERKLIICSG